MSESPLILILDSSGFPQRWNNYENTAHYYAKQLVAWELGSESIVLHGGISRLTGKQSTLVLNTIVAIKGHRNPHYHKKFHSVLLTNDTLFRRDKYICAYCGNDYHPNNLTRDHILPTSRGGKDIWENVVTACKWCNVKKDDNTPIECGMELLYTPYVPNRCEELILRNRKILMDQMSFLMKHVPNESRLHN